MSMIALVSKTAGNHAQRIAVQIRSATTFVASRLRGSDASKCDGQQEQPTVAERQEELIAFYQKYEELVELLCDGAQYGPEGKLELRYQESRTWMLKHYGRLRSYLLAFLGDEVTELSGPRKGTGDIDAFEQLFLAPTLEEFLRSDDGFMVGRIMSTRQALTLYGEHLRKLSVAA
ncbi:MAG: hypothetical protein JST40_10625 [Armatimonadetes bacterium]|nr:hypothetical protein [Armatimonadota bacterium]